MRDGVTTCANRDIDEREKATKGNNEKGYGEG